MSAALFRPDGSRLRVAYLFSRYPFVSQTFTDQEVLALERRGHSVTICSIFPPVDSFRHGYLDGLRADILYGPASGVRKALEERARRDGTWPGDEVARHGREFGVGHKPRDRARNALYFAEFLRDRGIGHVHVPFANRATHTMLFLKRLGGITFSFTTHGQDFLVDLGSDDLLRALCREAEFVVAVCDYSRELLTAKCPESAGKITRIYNGMDPSDWPARGGGGAGREGPMRLASVGRLIGFKGFDVLVEAVALAVAEGCDVELRIAGEGPLEGALRERIGRHGLAGRVRLLGRLDRRGVRELLASSDAFALACARDPSGATDLLPTVITEAMFSGLPVLSTRLAGVPEMVVDGVTGILAEPGDAGSLRDAIVAMAGLPDRGRSMGLAGRERAGRLFAVERTIPRLEEMLAGVPGAIGAARGPGCGRIAYFDPALPGRAAWLAVEAPVLAARGFRVLVPHGAMVDDPAGIEFLPDGIALDMEWTARREWRHALEDIRTGELGMTPGGERYLAMARRAVWIARRLRDVADPVIYSAGSGESLTAWLVSRLVPVVRLVSLDDDAGWSRSLLGRIARDARAVSDSSGKIEGGADVLRHRGRRRTRRRFGPVTLRMREPDVSPSDRAAALSRWLDEALPRRAVAATES